MKIFDCVENVIDFLRSNRQLGNTTSAVSAIKNSENAILLVTTAEEAHRISKTYNVDQKRIRNIHVPLRGICASAIFDACTVQYLIEGLTAEYEDILSSKYAIIQKQRQEYLSLYQYVERIDSVLGNALRDCDKLREENDKLKAQLYELGVVNE